MFNIYVKDDKVLRFLEKSYELKYITKETLDNFKNLLDALKDKNIE